MLERRLLILSLKTQTKYAVLWFAVTLLSVLCRELITVLFTLKRERQLSRIPTLLLTLRVLSLVRVEIILRLLQRLSK
ncbi:hypothetical protein D6858_02785 [Tsuneonella suprasediminis]|uniref:Uncharacterized protein n=1 Tax=Tsuneonella suprasediminis TaxID=2306996 RepID=A0A419R4H7_9SPHN|nr:hypothetical protein D6858_02785 [Tsuneonella suprasediminis]